MSPRSVESQVLRYKYIYSMTGLVLGFLSIIGGIALFFIGVSGSISWTAKILGNESTIGDAAPGAVLFVVGLFIIIVTRYKISIEEDTKEGAKEGAKEGTKVVEGTKEDIKVDSKVNDETKEDENNIGGGGGDEDWKERKRNLRIRTLR